MGRLSTLSTGLGRLLPASAPVQMQIDYLASALGNNVRVAGDIPTPLLSQMLPGLKLLSHLAYFLSISEVCPIVIRIFAGVDNTCRQGTLLFLGHACDTGVAVAVVPPVENLSLPLLLF